jgi:hypothetical protein
LVVSTAGVGLACDLGVRYREPEETVAASLHALYDGGLLTARHVGDVATTGTGSAASG